MGSLSKNLIFLQSVAANPCCSHVMPRCWKYAWRRRNETKSLLWAINTCLYYLTHTGMGIANYDPLYHCVGVISPHGHFPHLSFAVLPRNLYTGPKSSESFFRSYQGDWSFKELLMHENARRLQDVVDKGPWLLYRDDQLAGDKVFSKNRSTIWLSSNQNRTGGYTKNIISPLVMVFMSIWSCPLN